jgi:hypothetical protein
VSDQLGLVQNHEHLVTSQATDDTTPPRLRLVRRASCLRIDIKSIDACPIRVKGIINKVEVARVVITQDCDPRSYERNVPSCPCAWTIEAADNEALKTHWTISIFGSVIISKTGHFQKRCSRVVFNLGNKVINGCSLVAHYTTPMSARVARG